MVMRQSADSGELDQQSDRERAIELLWQRDTARAENVRLRAENERLSQLLRYAEEAMREEYRLRVAVNGRGDQ